MTGVQTCALPICPETEAYLVELLVTFSATNNLFDKDGGRLMGEPLALMLAKASEAPAPERARQLRRMGDTALYVSGFFSDSLQRQLVDVDYYASMGGRAYDALGDMNRGAHTGQIAGLVERRAQGLAPGNSPTRHQAALKTNGLMSYSPVQNSTRHAAAQAFLQCGFNSFEGIE